MRFLVAISITLLAGPAWADDVSDKPRDGEIAISRGLAFLAKDALAWKEKHKCASCHHAALVVWAMREAKQRGHTVDEPVLADMTKWLAESGEGKTGVPRPEGIPKALNAKAVYFAIALQASNELDAPMQAGIKLLLGTVKGDQLDNGSWASWPNTRPPIFGNSDDSMTALATLALLPAAANDAEAKAARDKAVAWLASNKTDGDPQSVAMRLVIWQRMGRPAEELAPLVQRIKERQNTDGGWNQAKEMASDAWATGQALYALSEAGLQPDDPIIAKGQAFLVKTQREDGSWPMMSRPTKPTEELAPAKVAMTGAGSAWGVLGLVRSRERIGR